MKKYISLAAFAFALGMSAQTAITTFTIASYNVDGLPSLINSDGPGSSGTKAMSQKIATEQEWDFFSVSEDFDYNNELTSAFSGIYNSGTYRGSVSLGAIFSPANTDGLNFFWKTKYNVSGESWTAWTDHKGGINDQANDLIKKGYRHYVATVEDNKSIDVYILHMEAGTDTESDGSLNDHSINANKQLTQLVTAIKATNNKRPIIVMGDTNCRYTREYLKELFIDALNADDRFTANDGWVEVCRNGNYPENGTPSLSVDKNNLATYNDGTGEIVDKIFYINNSECGYQLKLEGFRVATDFVKDDGSPYADHFPVVAKFSIEGEDSGTETPDPENPDTPDTPDVSSLDCSSKWAWTGEAYGATGETWYLYTLGRKQFLAKNETTVTDINDANVVAWTLTHSAVNQAGEVKYEEGSTTYNMWMGYNSFNYKAGINTEAPWTSWGSSSTNSLTIKNGSNANSYSFGYKPNASGYKYFQAQESGIFKGGDTNDQWSDWYLVSPAQKVLYDQYVKDLKIVAELNLAGIPDDTYQTLAQYVENTMNMSRQLEFHDFITNLYYDATITTADYSTLCLPFNAAVPEDVKVYYGSAFSEGGTTLILKEMNGDVLPANTGVVLYANVDTNTTFRFWKTQEEVADNQPENLLIGTNTRIEASERDNSYLYYALANMTTGVGFHEIDETKNVAIPAHRAYLQIEKTNVTASNAFLFSLDNDSLTTDITSVNHGEKNCETIFNLNGIRTNRLQQGVNIIRTADGTVRKVIVK